MPKLNYKYDAICVHWSAARNGNSDRIFANTSGMAVACASTGAGSEMSRRHWPQKLSNVFGPLRAVAFKLFIVRFGDLAFEFLEMLVPSRHTPKAARRTGIGRP